MRNVSVPAYHRRRHELAERHVILDELVGQGLITSERAGEALAQARAESRPVLRLLVDDRIVSEEEVYRVVAAAAGMEYVNPEELNPDPSAIGRLEGDWAKRLRALPYGWDGDRLIIAVDDPTNLQVVDDLRRLTRAEPVLSLAPPASLSRKIGQVYRAEDELDNLSDAITTDVNEVDTTESLGEGAGTGGEAPIIRYVNLLIAQAIADRASDIHIEPTETEVQIRYRIDGVLHYQNSSSRNVLSSVVSRIKIMTSLDIAERRVPQDGRMTVALQGRKIDLRVTTLPTVYGEKVVMRILDNSAAPLDLEDVGLSQYHRDLYSEHYMKPHGMILVTGPTGSGKSTTLYATLNTIRRPSINIVTVEDPVEYRMNGIAQMQINNKAGLSFATALRSILRADPDVILVGEIRDRETSQIAIEAALTGHLVLTTLHTNDAPSAVTRLIEMGIEPFLVGSALRLVVAQRLLRRLCPRCSEEYQPDREDLEPLGFPLPPAPDVPTLRKAAGCTYCSRTGYRGRTAIHEILVVDPVIERMASDGSHTDQIRDRAIQKGMRPMRTDGWEKVLEGTTTIEEVLRVTV